MNQIVTIRPYCNHGTWMFDDETVGLKGEALVAGIPEIIGRACGIAQVKNPKDGFILQFSGEYFPHNTGKLDWLKGDRSGNWYQFQELQGWLCPALFRYFVDAPKEIYFKVSSLEM